MSNEYLGPIKFLVVDDNHFMRSIVLRVLYTLGAGEIMEAENGDDAINVMADYRPDIAIVDWEMQPTDGIEYVKWLRNDPSSPNPFLPVIMLTAYAEIKNIRIARDAGVNEFVVKPMAAKVMWSRIRATIEKPRRFVRTKSYFGPDRRRQDVNPGHEDRRGKKTAAVQSAAMSDAPMSQDAINAFFNPDQAPKED